MLKSLFSYFLIILCVSFSAYSQDLQEQIDSLVSEFDNMTEKERSTAFIKVFSTKYVLNDIDKARTFTEKIEEYALEKQDTILLIGAKVLYSECHWRKGEYQKGIELALKSIALAETNKRFQNEKAQGLLTVGSINFFSGNSEKAIEYYKLASVVFKKNDNHHAYISAISNIGGVYADLGEKESSQTHFDSALVYLNLVIQMKEQSLPSRYLAALGNSALIYIFREDYDTAKKLYDQWEKEEAKKPNTTSRASQYSLIGMMHMRLNNFSKAEEYFQEGLNYAEQIKAKEKIITYYEFLSELQELKNNYKEAMKYAKKAWILKDSIFNIEKVNAVNELETKYQTAKKEQEIELAKIELEKKRIFQIFLFIAIFILAIASTLFFIIQKQKNKLRQQALLGEISEMRIQIKELLGKYEGQLDIDIGTLNSKLVNPLSEREFDIFRHIFSQKTNQEIADELFVSINTVKTHLKNIYAKLGVSNRKEALEILLDK